MKTIEVSDEQLIIEVQNRIKNETGFNVSEKVCSIIRKDWFNKIFGEIK